MSFINFVYENVDDGNFACAVAQLYDLWSSQDDTLIESDMSNNQNTSSTNQKNTDLDFHGKVDGLNDKTVTNIVSRYQEIQKNTEQKEELDNKIQDAQKDIQTALNSTSAGENTVSNT